MRSYGAARSLFSFLAFMAWSVVVIGVIVALVSAAGASRYGSGGAGLLAMVPGLGIGIAGFILVAFVQMGRAAVDTAEYTQQMLKIARDQLEVSRQALTPGNRDVASFTAKVEEATEQTGPSFNDRSVSKQAQIEATPDVHMEDSPKKIPAPRRDENGFLLLNEEGSLLEYRGRQIEFHDGKYNLAGQGFTGAKTLKWHLDGLEDLSS